MLIAIFIVLVLIFLRLIIDLQASTQHLNNVQNELFEINSTLEKIAKQIAVPGFEDHSGGAPGYEFDDPE